MSARDLSVDHSRHLTKKLSNLLTNAINTDTVLVVNDVEQYRVHKIVLGLFSDIFEVMLNSRHWSDSEETVVRLKEDPECAKFFQNFLQYLYTGQLSLRCESILPILILADKYNVSTLLDECTKFMCKYSFQGPVVSWYQVAKACSNSSLENSSFNYIVRNFNIVIESDDFMNFDEDTLTAFLERDDLVVESEHQVLKSCMKWLDQNGHHSQDLSVRLLQLIRFPMMSRCQLLQLKNDLSSVQVNLSSPFIKLLTSAVHYHDAPESQHGQPSYLYRPRTFLGSHWATFLSISSYRDFPKYGSKTLIFSTPYSSSEKHDGLSLEWNIDIFPKGVCIPGSKLIGLFRSLDVPGTTKDSTRLTVRYNSDLFRASIPPDTKVILCILIFKPLECERYYVSSLYERQLEFTADSRIVLIDDLIPYEELNGGDFIHELRIGIVIKRVF